MNSANDDSRIFFQVVNKFLPATFADSQFSGIFGNLHITGGIVNAKEVNIILVFVIVTLVLIITIATILLNRRNLMIRRRLEDERRFAELQFNILRSQLDPHFVFNSLNAIGSSIYQDEKETSYDFLQRFATLIRSTLVHADKSYRTLKEELEFVINYLELEKFRFENKFNYTINIQEGISQEIIVPKMIIQTFAENAVKHGLVQKSGTGMLSISMKMEKEFLNIVIDDNGIGRTEALKFDSGSAVKGMEILKEFISLFNRANKNKIHFGIGDILDNSKNIAGTRVDIKLPIDFTYNSTSVHFKNKNVL